ncbi:MAG: hypothetical protein RLY43_994 [Bacteroidota bacterium]|jgi:hypothetical protein
MAHSVQVKDLQVGMRVTKDVLGKRGDVKVRTGEVLSNLHVTKMKDWEGLDAANPKGIEVESSLHSGSEYPETVMKPWLSPVIQAKSKKNLQSTMTVPAMYDEAGKLLNPSPLEKELESRENNEPVKAKHRGRPKKNRVAESNN